ncbi:TBC1 domain family member 22B isoform X2 [Lates japonicus]|uniref:TBC1 domain family member 22B isoform X2 n=1 Tax=Lates japonicus TaxID=270547 RepID=A0AAD3M143_LATJO|nr:TBC1 domain family member 22B isoform X2 [Lates japonicus]
MATENRINFWRRNAKVPGRYPKDTKLKFNNLKSKKASSFHEFARSTNDAWDIDDEEDEDFLGTPAPASTLSSGLHSTSTQNQPLQNQAGDTQNRMSLKLAFPSSEAQNLQDVQEDDVDCEHVNGKVVKSNSEAHLNSSSVCSTLQKQQSLPVRPIIPLVARISDQNASGAPPMTVREKSRLDKSKQLLASPNTDLGNHNHFSYHVFERILFIWAIRHPASGYVQGINDLVTPFFVVFLSEFVTEDVENFDVAALPLDTQRNIEADSFWCMSKLLDGIQDNYTFAQPGIQNKVKALEELVSRIDEDIHNHFKKYEVEYLQFAFRWMNNLLMRELPLRCTIRLWDTYQAEAEGFSHFHLYVCAAFLIEWRKEILSMVDFQGLLMLLQNVPTIHWGNEEVGLLLAEAYRLKYMFADAPSHYRR